MTTKYAELDNGFKIRIDLDANNQISFFDCTMPRRELNAEDYRTVNKEIEKLKS